MIRFASMNSAPANCPQTRHEIAQDAQPRVSGLLGMELHAAHVRLFDDGRERVAVHRDGARGAGHGRGVRVREVHVGAIVQPFEQRRLAADAERIPPDVRDLQCARAIVEPRAAAVQHREPARARRLLASFEQPLHAEADPEERTPSFDTRREWPLSRGRRATRSHRNAPRRARRPRTHRRDRPAHARAPGPRRPPRTPSARRSGSRRRSPRARSPRHHD